MTIFTFLKKHTQDGSYKICVNQFGVDYFGILSESSLLEHIPDEFGSI